MPAGVNTPVLVGLVPLFAVSNITLNEGYQVARVPGSSLAQLVAPTTKSISIDAVLVGPERLLIKKALEAMALTSRALAAVSAPLMKVAGVPVVSGLTLSTDMQITSLRFTQSNQKRDAIDVSITLEHIPRSSLSALIGEALDLVLGAGTLALPSASSMAPITRQLGLPL
jgi:hypothetical protein